MQLDLDRPLRPVSFLSCLCFVFLLVRHLSPLQASTGYHLFCVVQSKQAHLAMANLLQRESNMAPHSLLKQAGSLNVGMSLSNYPSTKTNENSYFTRTKALREEIQALLDTKQVEAAKAVQEEKALVESLYAPYPTWPFHVRSKISSTVLEVSGSLLIGLITAALWQYFFPALLTLLFHTP